MPLLTIGWEYLTGYAVATDPGNYERAEWPPHPGRVFMALAAAWFETKPAAGFDEEGEYEAEGDALRWLETLSNPQLQIPPHDRVAERSNVTVYVPVNDKAGPSAATLQSAPSMTRSKQPRFFPKVHVGSAHCLLHWPDATEVDAHRDALDRLCAKVTRIGHSSSLVRMWVAAPCDWETADGHHLIPDDHLADWQARSISIGTLKMLADRFGAADRDRHAELREQVEALQASKKAIKGAGASTRKQTIDDDIRVLSDELSGILSRPPVRPVLGLWSGYRRGLRTELPTAVNRTHFDTDVLILTQHAGPRLPLVSTLAIAQSLRGAVMTRSGIQPVPPWVSGHQSDGSVLDDDDGHLACIPLPFVGDNHADGHLLGVGLVFPRSIDRQERGRVLGPLLLTDDRQPRDVVLKLGRLGVWTVRKRDWSETRRSLLPEVWTAHPTGATTWASVTPVVLDRFPKSDRTKNRATWNEEVAGILMASCQRIGLPEPTAIDIDTTCWHNGSPRAIGKRRPLRGDRRSAGSNAAFGDGFPFYPSKGSNGSRPQVHVWIEFSEPVVGPVLLGAGRYHGYGLCKPHTTRTGGRP